MGIKEDTGNDLNRLCLEHLQRVGIKVVWRSNNVAVYDPAIERFRKFLGRKGVSDILGVMPIEADLWNHKRYVFGVILCVETKARKDRLSKEQRAFADDVRREGGVYIAVRKIGDLLDALAALERENADLLGPTT